MSLADTFLSTRRWRIASYLLVVCLFVLLSLVKCRSLLHEHDVCFGDARVYARAIHSVKAGGNPYRVDGVALPFVYPPLFLWAAASTGSFFPEHLGWIIYLGVACSGLLSIPWLITVGYVRSEWLTAPIAMILLTIQPRLVEELMLLSGNIANPLYAAVLATAIPGIRRNRWLLFYIVVTLASLIKPPFLALLILPLLAGTQQFLKSVLPTIAVFFGYGTQRLLMPQAYMGFQRATYEQIFIKQDTGYGIYNYVVKAGHGLPLMRGIAGPMAAHILVMTTLIAPLIYFRKYRHRPGVSCLWLPVLLVTGILANPRMQRYDSDVAIIPAIYICIECLKEPGCRWKTVIVAVSLTLFASVYTKPELGMFLVLLTSIVLTINRLRRECVLESGEQQIAKTGSVATGIPS